MLKLKLSSYLYIANNRQSGALNLEHWIVLGLTQAEAKVSSYVSPNRVLAHSA